MCPLKFLKPYTTKYAFYGVSKIAKPMISYSYDILSLSETGPWCHVLPCPVAAKAANEYTAHA